MRRRSLRARPGRSTVFATGIVDLHGGKLIDITEGRSRKVLADWLIDQPTEWVAGIQVAALDPFRGYGAALSAGLPHAVRVLDAFHVVRLGFAAVDDVRRRVQQHTCGHRGRHDDPLDGIRRVLRRGAEHLTTTGWARLLAASRPATMTARSPPPGSPPRNSARSTAAAIAIRPAPVSTTGP